MGGGVVAAGAALGFTGGFVAGVAMVCLLRAETTGDRAVPTTLKIVAQLLGIPGVSLGCIAGSKLVQLADLAGLLPAYSIAYAITMTVIAGYPVTMFIAAVGRQIAPTRAASVPQLGRSRRDRGRPAARLVKWLLSR